MEHCIPYTMRTFLYRRHSLFICWQVCKIIHTFTKKSNHWKIVIGFSTAFLPRFQKLFADILTTSWNATQKTKSNTRILFCSRFLNSNSQKHVKKTTADTSHKMKTIIIWIFCINNCKHSIFQVDVIWYRPCIGGTGAVDDVASVDSELFCNV